MFFSTALIALMISTVSGSDHQTELHRIVHKVGRCRALCIDAFSPQLISVSDAACRNHADCYMCWENCEMFSLNFDVWGNMCAVKEVCFEGCLLACRFYSGSFPTRSATVTDMTESIAFDRDIREGILTIQWAPPANVSKQLKVVYALFTIRRQPNEDSLDGTTVSPHKLELLSITVDRIFESRDAELIVGGNVPKFLVVAMNRNGLVGQAFFPRATAADTFPFGNLLPTTPGAADKPSELNDVRLLVISVCVCAVVCGALLTVFGLFLRHLVRKQRMHRRIGRSYAFKKRFGVHSIKNTVHKSPSSSAKLLSTLQSVAVGNDYCTQPAQIKRPKVSLKLNTGKCTALSRPESAIVSIVSSPSGRDIVTIDYDQLKVKLSEQKSVEV